MPRPDPPDDTHRWMYFEGGAPADCQYWWCSRCGAFCEQPVGANKRDGPQFWGLDIDKEPSPANECPECMEAIYSPLDSDVYLFGMGGDPTDGAEVEVRVVKRRFPNAEWRAIIAWPFISLRVAEPKGKRDAAEKAYACLLRNIQRLEHAREQLKQMILQHWV